MSTYRHPPIDISGEATYTADGLLKTSSSNLIADVILSELLTELKINNLHQALLRDDPLTVSDLER